MLLGLRCELQQVYKTKIEVNLMLVIFDLVFHVIKHSKSLLFSLACLSHSRVALGFLFSSVVLVLWASSRLDSRRSVFVLSLASVSARFLGSCLGSLGGVVSTVVGFCSLVVSFCSLIVAGCSCSRFLFSFHRLRFLELSGFSFRFIISGFSSRVSGVVASGFLELSFHGGLSIVASLACLSH